MMTLENTTETTETETHDCLFLISVDSFLLIS